MSTLGRLSLAGAAALVAAAAAPGEAEAFCFVNGANLPLELEVVAFDPEATEPLYATTVWPGDRRCCGTGSVTCRIDAPEYAELVFTVWIDRFGRSTGCRTTARADAELELKSLLLPSRAERMRCEWAG